jgi:hypothetical protein
LGETPFASAGAVNPDYLVGGWSPSLTIVLGAAVDRLPTSHNGCCLSTHILNIYSFDYRNIYRSISIPYDNKICSRPTGFVFIGNKNTSGAKWSEVMLSGGFFLSDCGRRRPRLEGSGGVARAMNCSSTSLDILSGG